MWRVLSRASVWIAPSGLLFKHGGVHAMTCSLCRFKRLILTAVQGNRDRNTSTKEHEGIKAEWKMTVNIVKMWRRDKVVVSSTFHHIPQISEQDFTNATTRPQAGKEQGNKRLDWIPKHLLFQQYVLIWQKYTMLYANKSRISYHTDSEQFSSLLWTSVPYRVL